MRLFLIIIISLSTNLSSLDDGTYLTNSLYEAYKKNLLDEESEYLALTQLLLEYNEPYLAAEVFEQGQKKMIAGAEDATNFDTARPVPLIKDTEENLLLLANAWIMAQETDKAIPVLEKVAKISKPGAVYLTLGQLYFELKKFDDAKKNFLIAAQDKDETIKQNALNWIKYTENEDQRVKAIAVHGKDMDGSYSYIPIFKVAPMYPRRAQERGTMGYVVVEFTITDSGTVESAQVVEGYCSSSDPGDPSTEFRPCSIFDSASIKAALQLKYMPQVIAGIKIPVEGVLHKFTYVLEN